jgi:hypothetical protein
MVHPTAVDCHIVVVEASCLAEASDQVVEQVVDEEVAFVADVAYLVDLADHMDLHPSGEVLPSDQEDQAVHL